MRFRATVQLNGKTATGIEVPDEAVAGLGQGQRLPVKVIIFEALPYSHRKEWVRWVTEAKKPDTRTTRITKTVQSLHEGKTAR